MPRQETPRWRVFVAAVAVALATPAAPVSGQGPLLFFGDSFVDTGNFYDLIDEFTFGRGGFPPAPPYHAGRFSNGPVWTEQLADRLGRSEDAQASRLGGRNYAYGGATTGNVNVTFNDPRLRGRVDPVRAAVGAPPVDWASLSANGYGLRNQVQTFAAASPTGNTGSLAVLFAGGNDFVNNLGPDPRQTITNAVTNMIAAATTLYGVGVRDFLVPTLPDLSRTPRARLLPPAQAAGLAGLVGAYNGALRSAFANFAAATGSNYLGLSLDVLFDNMLDRPGAYGFSNTAVPCLAPGAPSCAVSIFADEFHPTTRAHAVVAAAAYRRVVLGADVTAVPEPSTLVLLAGGLGLVAAGRVWGRRGARTR